jgi:hypothetical protein
LTSLFSIDRRFRETPFVMPGFSSPGTFEHSKNWTAADGTPVQFTDDPALARAVTAAGEVLVDGVALRVIAVVDLLHEKLRAGSDPAPRRSRRLQDLADAQGLVEGDANLLHELAPDEREILDRLPRCVGERASCPPPVPSCSSPHRRPLSKHHSNSRPFTALSTTRAMTLFLSAQGKSRRESRVSPIGHSPTPQSDSLCREDPFDGA